MLIDKEGYLSSSIISDVTPGNIIFASYCSSIIGSLIVVIGVLIDKLPDDAFLAIIVAIVVSINETIRL